MWGLHDKMNLINVCLLQLLRLNQWQRSCLSSSPGQSFSLLHVLLAGIFVFISHTNSSTILTKICVNALHMQHLSLWCLRVKIMLYAHNAHHLWHIHRLIHQRQSHNVHQLDNQIYHHRQDFHQLPFRHPNK